MIQDYDELFKECVEIVEMTDDTKLDLDKLYFEYNLSFICVLLVIYEGQDYRTFRFGYMDMNIIVIDSLLPNFIDNDEYIDVIFLLDNEIFVVDEVFF